MRGEPHLPYGATAPPQVPAPLPPGWQLCPCGQRVRPWFKGRGFWHGIWIGFISPLITLILYAFIVAVALSEGLADQPVVRGVVLAVLPLSYLVLLLVLVHAKHRGGCLLARSLAWFFVWPGATLTAIWSVFA